MHSCCGCNGGLLGAPVIFQCAYVTSRCGVRESNNLGMLDTPGTCCCVRGALHCTASLPLAAEVPGPTEPVVLKVER